MEEKENQTIAWSQVSIRKTILNQKSLKSIEKPTYHQESVVQFLSYISKLDTKLEEVNNEQFNTLKKKYRYYLSKMGKLQTTKKQLEDRLNSFEQIIDSSPTIIQSKTNIQFIQMILEQNNQKLNDLEGKLNSAKSKKKDFQAEIIILKKIIKQEKDSFFEMKRQQLQISTELKQKQKKYHLGVADNRFKSILANKANTIRNHSRKPTQKLNNQQIKYKPLQLCNKIDITSKSKHRKNISVQGPQLRDIDAQFKNTDKKLVTETILKNQKESSYFPSNEHSFTIPTDESQIALQFKADHRKLECENKDQMNSKWTTTKKITNKVIRIDERQPEYFELNEKKSKNDKRNKMVLVSQLRKIKLMKEQIAEILDRILQKSRERKTHKTRYGSSLKENQSFIMTMKSHINNPKFWKYQNKIVDRKIHFAIQGKSKQLSIFDNIPNQSNSVVFPQINNTKNYPQKMFNFKNEPEQSDYNLLASNKHIRKFNQQKQSLEEFMKLSANDILAKIAKQQKGKELIMLIQKQMLSSDIIKQTGVI